MQVSSGTPAFSSSFLAAHQEVMSVRSVSLLQSYNDYMRDYHHSVGPPAPWQTLVSVSVAGSLELCLIE